MRMRIFALVSSLLLTLAAGERAAAFPDKPIRVIIPVVAGGSTDIIARTLQLAIERAKLIGQPMVIVNNGAAGGVVGTRMIKDAEPDGHTIGAWHMGLLTAPAMGVVEYDHTAYELIGQVGAIPVGLAVKKESTIQDIKDLISAANARPGEVTAAMNIGLLPHFVPLMLAHEVGVKFRFVQTGGGALRLKSVVGGHTEFSLFSVPELLTYEASGLRAITILAPTRDPRLPNIGTSVEAGYRTTFLERVMFLAPKGTPLARVETIQNALRSALADGETQTKFKDLGIDAAFIPGYQLKPLLDRQMAQIKPVADEIRAAMAAEKKSN